MGIALLFVLAVVGGAAGGVFLAYASDLPQISSLEDFQPNIITEVYTADGKVLGTFAIERRVVVPFADIPPVLRNAIIAVEDAEFWKHLGINPWRIPSAALANFRAGRRRQGSSTLTMQLSRYLFLTPEKTYERKLKEAILAFQIEKNFTKEEIFTLYCNQVYFGHGNYGVEAASEFFYSKRARELTLPEAAMIAGLPQSPSRLSPVEHPKAVIARRNLVLERMRDEKFISDQDAAAAKAAPLGLKLKREPPSIAPYFLEEVRKYLEREYGSQRIYQGGLRVHTTLDSTMQQAANLAVLTNLERMDRRKRGFVPPPSVLKDGRMPEPLWIDDWARPLVPGGLMRGVVIASERNLAVVRLGDHEARVTPKEIEWTKKAAVSEALPRGALALFRVESFGEVDGKKVATVSLTQEPHVEGALVAMDPRTGAVKAMVGGYDFERSKFNRATQAYRQVGSAFKPLLYAAAMETAGYTPTTTVVDSPLSFNAGAGKLWVPRNFDGEFWGPISVRRALEHSRNIPAIRTLQRVGIETGIAYARRLGITGELPPYLPIALGAGEATLTELTAAYATFANQGLRMKPLLVTRITDRGGNVIEEPRPKATDAVRADTAYLMSSILKGVVERGTGVRARALNRPIAGKTGTTNDFTDGWFVGYEPSLAAGVWVGNDDKRESLGPHQEGSRTALPIWIDFWKEAMKERPREDFPVPGNIVFVPSGHGMEAYIAGTEPRGVAAAAPPQD